MKIEQLAEIVTMLAQNHPGADVVMVYRAKHGKNGYSNIQKPITGYRARHGTLMPDKIFLEVDRASSYEMEGKRDAE